MRERESEIESILTHGQLCARKSVCKQLRMPRAPGAYIVLEMSSALAAWYYQVQGTVRRRVHRKDHKYIVFINCDIRNKG